jgi:nicotinamidase-related amidase
MNKALLLVDIQNDYFPGGKMELCQMEQAADKARDLLGEFRNRQYPVFHVRHISKNEGATFFLPDTAGARTHETVEPKPGETVIEKHFPNSFRDTSLFDLLKAGKIGELFICGAMSHMCIDATTRAAFDLGFKCVVVDDACATRALLYRGQEVPAESVHAAFMSALSSVYAKGLTAREAVKVLGT